MKGWNTMQSFETKLAELDALSERASTHEQFMDLIQTLAAEVGTDLERIKAIKTLLDRQSVFLVRLAMRGTIGGEA
jgi:prefoldin subunit 5